VKVRSAMWQSGRERELLVVLAERDEASALES